LTRYLVTGAAGFIGSNFVDHLLSQDTTELILAVDALSYSGRRESLANAEKDDRFRFIHCDINEQDRIAGILDMESVDTIVHFAAESHVDRSISGPAPFIQTNITGTYHLLEAAREAWSTGKGTWHEGRRFHHVSTDEVFGSLSPHEDAFRETTAYDPRSPYSASKAASDHLVRAWYHTYGLPITISNCSNNYGPRQFPEKLLPLMILNALHGRALPVYGKGTNVRDWLHVNDHCVGLSLVLEKGTEGETYNIGTRNEWRNIDLVGQLCDTIDRLFAENSDLAFRFPDAAPVTCAGCRSLITFVADRPGHDLRYAIDATKIESLGFRAEQRIEDGLVDTVRWYIDNEHWWRQLIAGS
jgi:dTDP-glucose 4,6-dehydratase